MHERGRTQTAAALRARLAFAPFAHPSRRRRPSAAPVRHRSPVPPFVIPLPPQPPPRPPPRPRVTLRAMRTPSFARLVGAMIGTVVILGAAASPGSAQGQTPAPAAAAAIDASGLYQRNCASCHDGGNDRAPTREALRGMTPERIVAAMETGPMIMMAINRTAAERRGLAEFLTGKPFGNPLVTTPSAQAMCRTSDAFDASRGPHGHRGDTTLRTPGFRMLPRRASPPPTSAVCR